MLNKKRFYLVVFPFIVMSSIIIAIIISKAFIVLDNINAKQPETTPEKVRVTAQIPQSNPKGGNVAFLYAFENGKQEISGEGSYYSYRIGSFNSANADVCAVREQKAKRHFKITILNLDNLKTASCTVTDYGPNAKIHPDRVVDMSPKVFRKLSSDGTLKNGILKNLVLIID